MLYIKDYQTSLIEIPNSVSLVLYCAGCNLRCKYCYNKDLWKVPSDFNANKYREALQFLMKHKADYHSVVITGGEPTIWKEDLITLCRQIRATSWNFDIYLRTNGTAPSILRRLTDYQLVDGIIMDLKTLPKLYKKIQEKGYKSFKTSEITKSLALLRELQLFQKKISLLVRIPKLEINKRHYNKLTELVGSLPYEKFEVLDARKNR